MSKTIFVSIASYRDPELPFTVETLMQNADNPNRVSIGICQQYVPERMAFIPYDNIRWLNFNYIDSQGCCWARHHANSLYQGEDYFFQLDSHIALVPHWDTLLEEQIEEARKLGKDKVLFGMYPPAYDRMRDGTIDYKPCHPLITTLLATDAEIPSAHGQIINEARKIVRAPFINAGMMFGDGRFLVECPYDPEIYFLGEEILNTIKAYTNGYDLYNPGVCLGWHLYKRWDDPDSKNWTVHWNEKDEEKRVIKSRFLSERGRTKVLSILNEGLPGYFGNVRTVREYEEYINFDIRLKKPIYEDKPAGETHH